MTPTQATDGIVELGLPDGGRVLVSFGDDVAGDPDLENDILIAMLGGGDSQAEVCRVVADHATARGFHAVVSDGLDPVMVMIQTRETANG